MIDLVAIGREYADNLLGEPAISRCLHAMADEIAILRSKLSLRENLEQGLMAGVARLQDEVERLRNGALEARETVSQNGDFPEPDNAAKQDNNDRLAALQALAGLDEELSLPRRTPATHATPSEGSVHNGCTLTDAEREAVKMGINACEQIGQYQHWADRINEQAAATLRGLLARLGGER